MNTKQKSDPTFAKAFANFSLALFIVVTLPLSERIYYDREINGGSVAFALLCAVGYFVGYYRSTNPPEIKKH